MQEYMTSLQLELSRELATERRRRKDLLQDTVNDLHRALARSDDQQTENLARTE